MNTPETRTSDFVCDDCGHIYLSRFQKLYQNAITFHQGECGLCEENKPISHIESYNYLKEQE